MKMVPITDEMLSDAVHHTAKILDEVKPGWAHEIDEESLVMSDDRNCILAQLRMYTHKYPNHTNLTVFGFSASMWLSVVSDFAIPEPVEYFFPMLATVMWRKWYENEHFCDMTKQFWLMEINNRIK